MAGSASLRRTLVAGALLVVSSGVEAEGPSRDAIVGPSKAAPATQATAMPLADHRAVYKVTLLRATGAKSPTSARGKVSYEFDGSACAGYSQNFRQITEMQPAEGATRLSDMRSATFEGADGESFSFDVKTSVDRAAPETVDGHAVRGGGDTLQIKLSKPAEQALDVDQEVLFPTAHLKRIIAAARGGQHLLNVKVFDGSDDGKKVYDTTTIIGRSMIGLNEDAGAARVVAMDGMTRWPVVISYFEDGHKDKEPAYTLGFELYENGVSRALRFDYGDFVLAGQMVSLEMLPDKPCR